MRVLVCRARRDGEATARALAARGHEPVAAPVLVFAPLVFTLPSWRADALVITSAQAPAMLTDPQIEALAPCPVYTVGQGSGAAARRRGFADVRVGAGDAASLSSLLALTLPPASRLLYLAGRPRKPDLEAAAAKRYALSVIEIYEAREAPPWSRDIIATMRSGRVDACLHYSRRSAELALAFAERAGVSDAFGRLRHVCVSTDVAAPLRAAGASDWIFTTATPDEAGVLASLDGLS